MEDLVYRPLFLRLARRSGSPVSGRALFFSAREDALASLAALHFFLAGPTSEAAVLPGGSGISGAGLVLEWEAPRSLKAPDWEGNGELASRETEFSFTLGPSDELYASERGMRGERIVLPEGSGGYYAELDRRECAAEGRESRILAPAVMRRVQALLAGRPL
jgi:hypothetical protein